MKTSLAIDIGAPPELVFHLARDVERWPDLLPHYLAARVRERHGDGAVTVELVAVRPIVPVLGWGLPVAWRSRTWAERDGLQLRFDHQGGATDGMRVTWHIASTTAGCRVTIEHDFAARVPGWVLFVDRLFVRPIATRTLRSFRAIAEATNAAIEEAGRSAAVAAANKPA